MKTSAQNKEDLVLIQYFDGKRDGVFVDVGAHDGVQFSNTHLLETKFGWSGICIEPNPESFKKLVKNRPGSQCLELAIANHDPRVIQLLIPNGVAVLGSTNPVRKGIGHILGIQPHQINYNKVCVQTDYLEDAMDTAWIGLPMTYELLSVDTEWTELDVLKSASLDRCAPEVIVVEANDGTFAAEIENYLVDFGYHLCGFVGGINYFYVNDKSKVNKMTEAIQYVASGNYPNL
jgi:FkbM family methyltransferase